MFIIENYINIPEFPKDNLRRYYVYFYADDSSHLGYRLALIDEIPIEKDKRPHVYKGNGYDPPTYFAIPKGQILKYENGKWIEATNESWRTTSYKLGEIYYSNFDIYDNNKGNIYFKKNPIGAELVLEKGNTLELKEGMIYNLQDYVSVLPENVKPRVTYESSNPDICTVDKNGHIKALKEGECVITLKNFNF
ncbi:Ig-like domain-containing protein [Clostridium perfringens]|uniref:Ig-like domain-containing protein n=1 Tax=Clostridium perfringens TaxID=1502 RepID=UPI0028E14F1D|nr:Ig-like domain-containing protein [Clostridium perfringens]MDT9335891.1 Ig-like domain-containing protein [Clostridium perfringens]MDT9343647.1 Ig-like domain-containing protein [Clostridium perfringens]MDT9346829.1 Ig-like domain-containing protein [Clostridium perfringens]MDT9352734.1 Ig-like domain-containing protein [Clostridium perfringens]